jgi:lipopolysaccharide heptosyltransferase II
MIASYGGIWAREQSASFKRLLVTSMGGLGDGVLLASIIQHLQRLDPALAIEVLADYGARSALELLPRVQVFGSARRANGAMSVAATVRQLRRRDYDAVLAADHLAVTLAAALALARIPRRVGFAPLSASPQSRFYTDAIPLNEADSQWRSLLRLAQSLNPALPDCADVLPLPIAPATEQHIDEYWGAATSGASAVFAFHLGAGAPYRRWPLERFVGLAERLRLVAPGMIVLLTGDHSERELSQQFATSYSGRVIDRTGAGSLAETAALLRRCTLLVANDSGVMHLGAAMGAPTIGLFGPNSATRWEPRGAPSRALCGCAACRPCIDNYRGPAPSACVNPIAQECLFSITVDAVFDAIRDLLRRWPS